MHGKGLGSADGQVRSHPARERRHSACDPPQEETHTQWAVREWGAESRWIQTVEGTLVAKASIVELSLVELDEQPTLDGVLPAQVASAEALDVSAETRARARIFE